MRQVLTILKWSSPEKSAMLPYGWCPIVIDDGKRFVYSDDEDIFNIPIEKLDLEYE